MTLESIVICDDWQTISVLGGVLGNLRIGVHVDSEPESARDRITHSKFDAVIVDCELRGAADFLRNLRGHASCRASVPLAIAAHGMGLPELSQLGARFVFEKPISMEQAVRTLSAARNLMLRGRLRYFRQEVDIPVSLTFADKRKITANITNLSQGGIAIAASEALDPAEPVRLRFDLPETDSFVEARGEVAWTDEHGHAGIRFSEVSERLQSNLEQWLASKYFADLTS
ncbi:MAG TPA: PilZ domain-containing protein [Terriglobales bacterium]|jgi:DNA-binding NarL/FixJ family response regulator|nr:PilZ domain-containing protein [Terriglobales bacterium]